MSREKSWNWYYIWYDIVGSTPEFLVLIFEVQFLNLGNDTGPWQVLHNFNFLLNKGRLIFKNVDGCFLPWLFSVQLYSSLISTCHTIIFVVNTQAVNMFMCLRTYKELWCMITKQPVSLLRKLYLLPFYESSMWVNLGGVFCNLPLLPFLQELKSYSILWVKVSLVSLSRFPFTTP